MITIKKHLFLVGPSGGGKTTLLRETLGESLEYAGGFVTERVCAEDGSLLGFELLVPQFREAVESLLSSEQPVIGVLKDIDSAEELRRRFGLGEKYILLVRRLRQALEADPDTILLRSSGRDDAAARNIVRQWAAEYARAQY